MKRICRVALRAFMTGVLALSALSPMPGGAAEADRALAVVRRFADAVLAHGRDDYGPVHSPLFASALDRRTLRVLTNSPIAPEGIRPQDRALTGANPMHDENLFRLFYALAEVTGEARYTQAADGALRFFFTHCRSPETGLFAWGEHLSWDFRSEAAASSNDRHEFYRPWALWEKSHTLAPDACREFALGLWKHQIADQTTGNFNRHARFSRHAPELNNEYPRHAGFYIATWAAAWRQTGDTNFLHAIEVVAAGFERRRKPDGSFPASSEQPEQTWWSSDLSYAVDAWDAAALVPEPLANRLRAAAQRTDAAFLAANRKGLARGNSNLWKAGYGHQTPAAQALICWERDRQIPTEGHRQLVLRTADAYLHATPDANQALHPGPFGDVISLLLRAEALTGERRYLQQADRLSEQAMTLFWNDGPLPRASSRLDHYEAITRADTLALAFLELTLARSPDLGRRRLFPWIDR